jgi:hypothetical protein
LKDLIFHLATLWRLKWIVFFLYLAKFIVAFLLVAPFFLTNNGALSSSEFSKTLLSDWDISVLVELFSGRLELFSLYALGIVIGATIFAIIAQFLNGGLYYMVVSGVRSRINSSLFFAECGGNFMTHIKITFMMILIYMALLPAGMFFVNLIGLMVGNELVGGKAMILGFVKLGVLALIILAASIFSDSVRAASAASPEKQFSEIIRFGADFFRPRAIGLTGIFLTAYLPFVVVWGICEIAAIEATDFMTGLPGIFMEFILFQICSILRTGQKFWYLLYLGKEYRTFAPGRFSPKQAELDFGD